MRYIILCLLILSFAAPVKGARVYRESVYQKVWCERNKGETEVLLSDKCRIDCLTRTHAIEFDFADKWAESIGQALYYAIQTNKRPGIVLILENPQKEYKYVKRLKAVAGQRGIDYWLMYTFEIVKK